MFNNEAAQEIAIARQALLIAVRGLERAIQVLSDRAPKSLDHRPERPKRSMSGPRKAVAQ